jgi:DNA-binding MarR family transcriptional regulator
MKTNVRSSSIDSYYLPDNLKRFTNQHKDILEVFHNNPQRDYTRKEIAKITHLETSTVSARINELVHDHFALEELAEKRHCSISNINVFAVRLPKLPAVQRELFLELEAA